MSTEHVMVHEVNTDVKRRRPSDSAETSSGEDLTNTAPEEAPLPAPNAAPTSVPEESATSAAEFLDRFAATAKDTAATLEEESDARPAPEHSLKAIIEALVFASPEPISLKQLVKIVDPESKDAVRTALGELATAYERSAGLQLVEVAGGYEIVTRPELHEWVRRLFKERTTVQKLSRAALETLAVVAYKQPITAAEIGEVRGVNTAGVLGTLLERKLIKIAGRKQVVGRPFMYATTREFLDRFGLNDLSDLPKVEDMSELLGFDLVVDSGDAQSATLPFEGGEEGKGDSGGEAQSKGVKG